MKFLYTLDENHNPVLVNSVMEWAEKFDDDGKVVAQTQINNKLTVSTVFLGVDLGMGTDRPLLFETMIFGGELNGAQWRYSTWDEAVAGHQAAIDKIFEVTS